MWFISVPAKLLWNLTGKRGLKQMSLQLPQVPGNNSPGVVAEPHSLPPPSAWRQWPVRVSRGHQNGPVIAKYWGLQGRDMATATETWCSCVSLFLFSLFLLIFSPSPFRLFSPSFTSFSSSLFLLTLFFFYHFLSDIPFISSVFLPPPQLNWCITDIQ